MFDVAPTELLLVAVVALVVIGPKDLPKAMRVVGNWVGRAKGMARHFRSGIDAMIRESEIQEMEKKWKEENERIMREFPSAQDLTLVGSDTSLLPAADDSPQLPLLPAEPPTAEQPMTQPATPEPERLELGDAPPPMPDEKQP